MGTILASVLIANARRLLQDVSSVAQRYTDADMLISLNEGQRVLVSFKHDAYTKTAAVQLAGNTRNSIPTEAIAFVSVIRNMGTDGLTPGRAVTEISRASMNIADPDWHRAAASANVVHYMLDTRIEREYSVWPPTTGYIELAYVANPEPVALGAPITLDDIYAPALTAYIVYHSLAQDMDSAPNRELAQIWFGQFAQFITGKITSEESINNVNRNIP